MQCSCIIFSLVLLQSSMLFPCIWNFFLAVSSNRILSLAIFYYKFYVNFLIPFPYVLCICFAIATTLKDDPCSMILVTPICVVFFKSQWLQIVVIPFTTYFQLELKLGIGGTSYSDFISSMHLPMQLRYGSWIYHLSS